MKIPNRKQKVPLADSNPQQIMNGMAEKNRMLTQKNAEYIELVEIRAAAEKAHSVAAAKVTLREKVGGQSITLIPVIVRGDKVVADLKYALDISEGVMKACLQSIKNLTTAIDTYRSLLAWERAEYDRTQG